MSGGRTWSFLLVTGMIALVVPFTPAFSTNADFAAAEREYRAALEELPLTAEDENELEQHAVELAYALNEVPVSASSESCPVERLEVQWERPTGYEVGAYIEPVGPAPGPDTTHVTGVVVCDGSTYAFMGFEAHRDADDVWHIASVPDLPSEEGLDTAGLPLEGQDAPEGLADLSGLLSTALGPVDPYAPYEPQRICNPVEKPATAALARLLLERYPPTVSYGITRPCDLGGRSEHKEGRAFDWGADVSDPEERAAVEDFIAKLMATDAQGNRHALARRLGVMYVIWNEAIWSSFRADDGWRPYNGPSPHRDHLHVSLSWDGALGHTSLWQAALPEGWWGALPTFESAGETSFELALVTSSLASWEHSWTGPSSTRESSSDEPRRERRDRPSEKPSPSESPNEDSGPSDGQPDATEETVEDTVDDVQDTIDEPTTAPSDVRDTVEDAVDDVQDTVEDVTDVIESPSPLPSISESLGLD